MNECSPLTAAVAEERTMDRKQIKLIRRFKPGEVSKEEMRAIVEETEEFLIGQE